MSEQAIEEQTVWEPRSKPQEALVRCPAFEVFFGGARGSLKTDSMLGDWVSHSDQYGDKAFGLMIRRTREELTETFERARQIYTPLGFKFSGYVATGPSGSRITFAYLDRDSDAERYQGWNLTRVYVEELGNFPFAAPVLKLMATLRSPAGVPCGFRATGNPGGPGHHWVKERYIAPAPQGWEVQHYDYENPWTKEIVTRDRLFIPGKITDHNLLGSEYIANLQMSGSEDLVRAWLEGDWDAIIGAYFDCWRTDKHVVKPFALPMHWVRFRAYDWGYASPGCVQWWAIASEDHMIGEERVIPKGAMVCYREWYLAKQSGEGLRTVDALVAEGIHARERNDPPTMKTLSGEKVDYSVADPAIFSKRPSGLPGPPIAEEMSKGGVHFRAADNNRIQGWQQLRGRLLGIDPPSPSMPGDPMIFWFDTCEASIRTIPALQHDDVDPEDLDTEGEDHAADCTRYACMSRPWQRKAPPKPEKMKGLDGLTLDRLWKEAERGKRRRRNVHA